MVKVLMFIVWGASGICLATPLTNVTEVMGRPLSTLEFSRIQSCCAETPDSVFLGTVKALQTGCLKDLYFHFETNYLYELTGYYNPSNIPETTVSSFHSVMADADFSNVVVVAYSTTVSNLQTRVEASLRECYANRIVTENLSFVLRYGTAGWKIIVYDDDNWDE